MGKRWSLVLAENPKLAARIAAHEATVALDAQSEASWPPVDRPIRER